jgi:hypothetical protein
MKRAIVFTFVLGLGGLGGLGSAGCSIPSSQFQPSTDGGVSDGMGTGVLAIVPSVTALTVDENRSKELTVTLSQAPAAPLTIQVDSPSTAIGLTVPDMTFDASNYSQPRTIIVTGLVDANVADAQAQLTLKAAGVTAVEIPVTVDDMDTVTLVTNVAANNVINVNGGQFVDVTVHLSHQPDSDVTVMAILGAGPCSVNGTSRVFTPQGYDADQTFRFTAANDPNTSNDDQTLTLRLGSADRQYTLHEIDGDVLNIAISPSQLAVVEQSSAGNLNVALTQQPASNVTVSVSVVSQTGIVTVDQNQLVFTPQNYATNQIVKVTGADDADIDDDTAKVVFSAPGIATREVVINIADNDSQAIEVDALSALSVDESAEITYGVRLKQQPSADTTVAVQSLATGVATVTQGSVLTFTPQNYNVFQTVKVKGTHDTNLATNQTKIRAFVGALLTEVTVNVLDIDQQELVVSQSMLTLQEGDMRSFTVALKYEPLTTVAVTVTSSNATAFPVSPAMLTFTVASYATPKTVTVSPPLDTNTNVETSTITVSGGGAAQAKTVMATLVDVTTISNWGWPMPFPSTILVNAGLVVAYRIDVGMMGTIDSFHTYVPTAVGSFRMALYTDAGNVPGTLVAEMPAGKALANGVNDAPIANGAQLAAGAYFLVIRFSSNVNVGYAAAGVTGRQCIRNFSIPAISDPWPSTFGAAACTTDRLINMWMTTYFQCVAPFC